MPWLPQRYHSLLYLHGEFDGVNADQLPVFLRGQTFFRFDQTGRIIERWSNHDHAFRLQQLKGAEGRIEGEKLAAILNGSGLNENEVRQRIAAMNDAFNYVQSPAERRERVSAILRCRCRCARRCRGFGRTSRVV